jgi:hypothetical protein
MGLFDRLQRPLRRGRGTTAAPSRARRREEVDEVRRHLEDFVRTRVGVEAYLEPRTNVTPPTVLLIATTGEWTRRRIHDLDLVHDLAQGLGVPVYNVQLVGYPQRMRDWTAKVKREGGTSSSA